MRRKISKGKQVRFLLRYALLCPVWTALWYLDELFFSAYKQQNVKPVFIIGQPRSGTTFLHRTLANDTETFVAVRHIEWRYPYILVQKLLENSVWLDNWLNKNYWPDSEVGRKASKMHPNALSDWEEDGVFFEECFLHHFFIFLRFPDVNLLSYFDDFQLLPEKVQQRMLDAHKKVIQKVIYLRNGNNKFYLSKEVTSHTKIKKILTLYPDAKFIVSLRTSSGFMNSLLELVRYSTKSKTNIDPIDIPEWENIFVERMRQDSLLLVELCEQLIDDSHQTHVVFNQFTENTIDSIKHIYKKLGCDIGSNYLQYLKDLEEAQQKRKKGYCYEKNDYDGFERFDEFVLSAENQWEKSFKSTNLE
ncbi:MAG: sulfotransferase [Gammaproteobacteria bacterium]|nr:sulfotransferase [Gammaproteobacteria bacterium]